MITLSPLSLIRTIKNNFPQKKRVVNTSYRTLIQNRYRGLEFYNRLINNLDRKKTKPVVKNIHVLGCRLGMNRGQVLKQLGSPRAVVPINSDLDTEILYYKRYLGEDKVKVELHFYKDIVFFINLRFVKIDTHSKNNVIRIIKQKYNCEDLDFNNTYLEDQCQTLLSIDKKVNMDLRYFLMPNDFFKDLKRINVEYKNLKVRQKKQIEILYENL